MPKVCLYTTPVCPYCTALKNFLKEHNIEFKEVDVSEDEKTKEKIIQKTGQTGVPVIKIDDEFIAGFEKEKISQALGFRL
jgi:glutaredoxin-like YruB-family protein